MAVERVEIPANQTGETTIGVISDTHVPDRSQRLSPAIGRIFREEGVSAVLHAGDVAVPSVLEALGEYGPVIGVRGNRDWLLASRLPMRAASLQCGFGRLASGPSSNDQGAGGVSTSVSNCDTSSSASGR